METFAVQKFLFVLKAAEEKENWVPLFDQDNSFPQYGLDGAVQLQHTNLPRKIFLSPDTIHYI